MWGVKGVIFLVILASVRADISYDSLKNGSRVVDSLKFVAVITSEGNRAPLVNFKSSPYPNLARYWPYGSGQLSLAGRKKIYSLGVKVRSLYDGFISAEYSDSDFAVKSTDIDNALMCAETFVAGLYPPVLDYQFIVPGLNWMPVIIYPTSEDTSQDVSSCAKYVQIFNQLQTNFTSTYSKDITQIINYVNKQTDGNLTGLEGVQNVFDSFFCMVNEGYTLPKWTKQIYPTELNAIMENMFLDFYTENTESVKLLSGLLFEAVLSDMAKIISKSSQLNEDKFPLVQATAAEGGQPTGGPGPGPQPTGGPGPGPQPTGGPGPGPSPFGNNTPKLSLWSSHEEALLSLQKVLGIERDSRIGLISPASAIVFELHQDTTSKNYTVQALYIDGSSADMEPVSLPILGCTDDTCAYDYFVSSTSTYTSISNFDKECQTSS